MNIHGVKLQFGRNLVSVHCFVYCYMTNCTVLWLRNCGTLQSQVTSDVNKALGIKAKDFGPKAKDLDLKAKAKDLRCQSQ